MKKVAIVAVTVRGKQIALTLKEKKSWEVYLPKRFKEEGISIFSGSIRSLLEIIFKQYQGIVMVMALGIVVRLIAPLLRGKDKDPAVVAVDEQGRFAISVCSAHLGGANNLSREVAEAIGAIPVVTTASELAGITTPDLIAQKMGLFIDNISALRTVNRLILEGEKVVYLLGKDIPQEIEKILAPQETIFSLTPPPHCSGLVFVTDYTFPSPSLPYLVLRPRRMVAGIGFKKGLSTEIIASTLKKALHKYNIAQESLCCFATIERKKEKGLRELSSTWKIPLLFYSLEEIAPVAEYFPVSKKAKEVLGISSVARPCAFLASAYGKEEGYFAQNGVTIAIFRGNKKWVG
ncbi:MAG: cobalt-precorrin 5A hydrolase [Candidatus Caldatribacteriaceae bacterium]